VGYDPYVSAGTEIAIGIERLDMLEELLGVADVVSVHCPLNAETRGMIDAKAFRRMRSNAILINTARGQIVDVAAMIAAIREGVIAGAGIDVLPTEPPNPRDEIAIAYRDLRTAGIVDRLIVTPHAAWASPESRADARRLSVETAMMPGEGTPPQSRERSVPDANDTLKRFLTGRLDAYESFRSERTRKERSAAHATGFR
jgi:phosphoglycerate dehydrogenase-like enzyme